ncbi:glycosyltransferase [Paenibacillus sp. TAB 01]|uniref:glycosyltransferase n=1 Tax=Paenibacillus sp. TAB 01 TaxID=3368988 RepID=UPI003750D0A5
MKPKVSIVVPIYNVAPYLERCLDSLTSQTLEELEIIAVNDGSTDGSGELLDRYAAKDKRIVAIHQPNGGVSAARNRGIRSATADYIGFVDPDDWTEREMYAELYHTALAERADIVMCTYIREFGTHGKEKRFPLPEKVSYENEEVQAKLLRRLVGPLQDEIASPEYLDAWGTVWSKLYKTSLIRDHQVEFIDLHVVGTNEDSLFNIHAVYHARKFVFLNKPYYHYWRVNSGSVTSGYKPDLKDKWFELYGFIERFVEEKRLPPEFRQALNNRICLNTLGLGLNTISAGNKAPALTKLRRLRGILNDGRIRQSFKQFESASCSVIWRLFYGCARFRWALGFYCMLLAIDWLRRTVK